MQRPTDRDQMKGGKLVVIPEPAQGGSPHAQPITTRPPPTATFPVSLNWTDPAADFAMSAAAEAFHVRPKSPAFLCPGGKSPAPAGVLAGPAAPSLEPAEGGTGITVDRRSQPGRPSHAVTAEKLATNAQTAARLAALGHDTQARNLAQCQTHLQTMCCSNCNSTWFTPCNCKSRWCTICAPRKAAKDAKFALALFARAKQPKWLTLTQARSPNLATGLDTLKRAFRNWRLNPRIRRLIAGGLYHIEAKPKADGWHVHLHALVDAAYIPKPVLYKSWATALGQATASVQINRVSGAQVVRYVTKYALKPADIAAMDDGQLSAYVCETRKRRLIGTWGTWYNATLAKLEPDAEPHHPRCPFCHQPDTTFPIRAGPRVIGPDLWPDWQNHYYPGLPAIIPDPQWCDNPDTADSAASHDDEERF